MAPSSRAGTHKGDPDAPETSVAHPPAQTERSFLSRGASKLSMTLLDRATARICLQRLPSSQPLYLKHSLPDQGMQACNKQDKDSSALPSDKQYPHSHQKSRQMASMQLLFSRFLMKLHKLSRRYCEHSCMCPIASATVYLNAARKMLYTMYLQRTLGCEHSRF